MNEPGDEALPEPEGPVTIYDVARAAGVSASTVSRTFSRPGRVSARTAAQVRQVADELGYRTDAIEAAPVRRRTGIIGLAVSDVTNPFVFGIIRGAEAAAHRLGYSVLLADAQESEEIEQANYRRTLPLVEGIVVASSRSSDTELRMLAKQVPVVVLNRQVGGLPCVVPDNPRGMRRAVEHLAELGHQDIWYLAGPEASWADGVRRRALHEAAYELSLDAHRLGPNAPTARGGREAAQTLVEKGARAVVTYNDLMAFGLLAGLRELGVRVPEDMSVVGFDNAFGGETGSPGLTTVAAPHVRLGDMGVSNVVGLAHGGHWHRTDPLVLPVSLVVRGSTGPAPGRARSTQAGAGEGVGSWQGG